MKAKPVQSIAKKIEPEKKKPEKKADSSPKPTDKKHGM